MWGRKTSLYMNCPVCDCEIVKPTKYINRAKKLGMNVYCSKDALLMLGVFLLKLGSIKVTI